MRQAFVICYDIADPKRLRKVFKIMRGYGDHIQLSVFRCELNKRELVQLRVKLAEVIHHGEDQVLFVDVGPVAGRGSGCISSLGKPFIDPERNAVVL